MKGLLILLGILKWIGIVFLVLLLLLLMVLLVVLFSPIRYRLTGEKKEAISGSFAVSWLFGALKIKGEKTETGEDTVTVQFFGHFLIGGEQKKKKPKNKKPKKRANTQPEKATKPQAEKPAEEKTTPIKEVKEQKEVQEPTHKQPLPLRMEEIQPKTMRRVPLCEVEEKQPEEDLEREDFFVEKETEEEKQPSIWKVLWELEEKKGIFLAFGKLLKRLIKGILPGDLLLRATIGTPDPATTGYVLAAAGILHAKFGDDIQIKGDFTKSTVEDIAIFLRGKILLGGLLWAVLVFILTKPVRKVVWKVIKFLRGKKQTGRKDTVKENE